MVTMSSKYTKVGSGFTLISTVIAVTIGTVALMGGWVAVRDFQMQWRVANADRQMDQYAHACMTDLVNQLSWCSGAQQMQGGNRTHRWRFVMVEQVFENSTVANAFRDYAFTPTQYYLTNRRAGGFFEITSRPAEGILFNRNEPEWSDPRRGGAQYVWRGFNPRAHELSAFDRRDRMTVESLDFDFPLIEERGSGANGGSVTSWASVVQVTLTMQYRYDATYGVSVFTDEYVRERTYSTKIFLRNADVENNPFYDDVARGVLTFGI